jgi:hypothetical protein
MLAETLAPPPQSPVQAIVNPDSTREFEKIAKTKTNCEQLFWVFLIGLGLYIAGIFTGNDVRGLCWSIGGIFIGANEVCAVVYVILRHKWFWLQPRGVQIRGMIGCIGGLLLLLFSVMSMVSW